MEILKESKKVTSFSLVELQPTVIVVFDNKGSEDNPRLGIVKNGVIIPIVEGDSGVITAMDLESISLIEKNIYLAATSLGATYVFSLERFGKSSFFAKKISEGQLPVPENESTASHKDSNRTNIEAVFCVPGEEVTCYWASRGGDCDSVWVRFAPFDPNTGMVDETRMSQMTLKNPGLTSEWRAVSSLYLKGDYIWFTSALDGEELGHPIKLDDLQRESEENKEAFKSIISRVNIKTEKIETFARFDGMKLEAMTFIPSDDESILKIMVASDDEGLGSLIGTIHLNESLDIVKPVQFIDIASASEFYKIDRGNWGTSGMAVSL